MPSSEGQPGTPDIGQIENCSFSEGGAMKIHWSVEVAALKTDVTVKGCPDDMQVEESGAETYIASERRVTPVDVM
jgi:hypothetical protein